MGKEEGEDASRSVQLQLRWGQMGGVLAKPKEGKSIKKALQFAQRKAHLMAIAFFFVKGKAGRSCAARRKRQHILHSFDSF